MVNEQDAVQVINLMQQAACEQLIAFHLKELALEVLRTDLHPGGAAHLLADVRQREAALLFGLRAFGMKHLRIDKHELVFRPLTEADIDDSELFGDADLRGGETDAFSRVHAIEHLLSQLSELGVELGDGFAFFREDRVGVLEDGVQLVGLLTGGIAGGKAGLALGLSGSVCSITQRATVSATMASAATPAAGTTQTSDRS